ncbi:MAG: LacI family DNA-binding transcriptional regulator [Blautia sp.]|nr:LacI family DNA-binding transcriptional regulator [Blautia sp.]
MAGRVTLQDIADELGLSRNTVSKAINNTGVLADSTRERVLLKAKEMGYKQFSYLQFGQDSAAKLDLPGQNTDSSVTSGVKEIAILSAGFVGGSHFALSMIDRFQRDFSSLGYSISMYRVMPEELRNLQLPSAFRPESVSGIMCLELFDANYCRMLCDLGIPILITDGPVSVFEGTFEADHIMMDNQTQLFVFFKEMKKRGKTRVSYVGDIHHCQSFYERYNALRQAVDLYGLTETQSITGGFIRTYDNSYIQYLDESLLALPQLPDVFLCANDFVAMDILKILRKMNVSVPDDVWICGFDDSPESRIMVPGLTTVHIHSQIMGFTAVRLLHSRICAPDLHYRTVYTQTDLIYRGSTGD